MKTAASLKAILLNCLKPIPKVSVSSWADTFRMLPSDSPEPGRYKTARVPYFKEVQDAFTQPDVRRIAVKSAAQVGKALDVTTPIATPDGFKLMGDLIVGDKVFDENGEPCNVIGVSPIMYDHECYEITFSEGAKIVADAEHNWIADGRKVKTTELEYLMKLPLSKPLNLPEKKLPPLEPRNELVFNFDKPKKPFPPFLNDYLFGSKEQRDDALAICIELNAKGWQYNYLARSVGINPLPYEVKDVRRVASRPVRCIAVDSPNHLFLAGHELIPTSNSEVLLNIVGRTAHLDPANVMIIQPTLEMAQDFSKVRLAKMIQDSKVLTPLFYDRVKSRDANQTILSKFYKGGRIILVGANSSSGLASRPIKILLCDEVDRYPASAMGEGDPIDLASKRTSNFFDAKIALFSTPTTEGASRIDVEYLMGTQEEWSHECPNCGEWHCLSHNDMQVDYVENKDAAGNRSMIVRAVKWRCPDCGFEFSEREMRNAAQKYIAQNPDALANGMRSFFINGFCSPWLKWSDIMYEWLIAQGNPTREAVVVNTRFGLSYAPIKKVVDVEELTSRLEAYDGELPSGVRVLTAGVDVQANRLHFIIMGYAPDEMWGIRYGLIYGKPTLSTTWNKLDAIINRTYKFNDQTGLKVARTFIDSGFLPETAYNFCRGKTNVFAIKGMGAPGLPIVHKVSRLVDKNVWLVLLGVNAAKSEFFASLDKIHYGRDDNLERNFDATFFKELSAEQLVMKKSGAGFINVYENVMRSRNEALDCSCYALAALKSLQGTDEKIYWETLRGEPKKIPPKKISQLSMDLY